MVYRVCKSFEIESGHMLSKHPGRCRHPHGHSRRVDVVLEADTLDENDMVCDFAAIKAAIEAYLDRFDHATAINSQDPWLERFDPKSDRVVVFDGEDPTTEVLARYIYEKLEAQVASGARITDPQGREFTFRKGLRVERVRVGETSSSWAEYSRH